MKILSSSTMVYTTKKDVSCDPQSRRLKDISHALEPPRPLVDTVTTLILL